MTELFPISFDDMIAEVEREVKLRRMVYPRQVTTGRLIQPRADRQIAIMVEIAATLRRFRGAMNQT